MSSLSGSNILIVGEAPGTLELRERLIDSGANVHVVSVAGAKLLLQQKQIDTAFLAASLDHDTRELSEDTYPRSALRKSSSRRSPPRCQMLRSPDASPKQIAPQVAITCLQLVRATAVESF